MTEFTAPAAPSAIVVNTGNQGPVLPQKSVGVAYLFLFLLGIFGGHQYYLGKGGRGTLYLLTLGLLGFGVLIDLFTLGSQTRTINMQRAVGIR